MNTEPSKTTLRSSAFGHSRALSYSNNNLNANQPSSSSSKQKNKDLQFEWWDYAPIFENRKRPIHWADPSLIITSHATKPIVQCIHFPSNKTYHLPDPPGFQVSHITYEPPNIIAVSAKSDYVFALFPGINRDHIGCIWTKDSLLNEWLVKDCRSFPRGDSVVTARWLDNEREWAALDTGTLQRLPALGPYIPSTAPILITVTETHSCNIFHLDKSSDRVNMLSSSLRRRSGSRPTENTRQSNERVDGAEGLGRCLHATIGFAYDEPSILIATYSTFVPLWTAESSDINMTLEAPGPLNDASKDHDWDAWQEENTLEVCEASLAMREGTLQMSINPLPAFRNICPPKSIMTNLTFVPFLSSSQSGMPSTPTQVHRSTPQSSPATAPAHIPSPGRFLKGPVMKPSPSKPVIEKATKGRQPNPLCLLCTTLDIGQYASEPKSELISYVFMRSHSDQTPTWQMRHSSHLPVAKGVITHVSSCQPLILPQNTGVLIGVLSTQGQTIKRKEGQHLNVGKLQVLKLLPELSIDHTWEGTNILCPSRTLGLELPFSMSVSPNRSLICSTTQTDIGKNDPVLIHSHPMKISKEMRFVATMLQLGFQKRDALSDIIHHIIVREMPLSVLEDTIVGVITELESANVGLLRPSVVTLLGTMIELYRQTYRITKSELSKQLMQARCRVALEILSLDACNSLWEDILENDYYSLESAWSLLPYCTYYTNLIAEILRDLLSFYDSLVLTDTTTKGNESQDITLSKLGKRAENGAYKPSSEEALRQGLDASMTHIVLPFAFENLYRFFIYIRRFRESLGSKAKSDEQYLPVLEALSDIMESTALHYPALEKTLKEISDEINSNAERMPDFNRRCLARLQPPIQYIPLIRSIAEKVMKSGAVDKTRLFIAVDDFLDGVLGLTISDVDKEPMNDVVSKVAIDGSTDLALCVRCGSKRDLRDFKGTASAHSSAHWSAWERSWRSHCFCGGLWSKKV